jgi:hypothetical protein
MVFFFTYEIRNVPFNNPVFHKYYTAWFSLVRFFFLTIIYLCENFFSCRCLKQVKINITGQILVSQWHYSLHTKYTFSSFGINIHRNTLHNVSTYIKKYKTSALTTELWRLLLRPLNFHLMNFILFEKFANVAINSI